MNFVDRSLVRLADPGTRAGLFDEDALGQIAAAAYDTDVTPVQGPFQALFDELSVGFSASRASGLIHGTWRSSGGAQVTEVNLQTSGLGGTSPAVSIEALWRGSIVVRSVPQDSHIIEVGFDWPEVGTIDDEIVTNLGSLPSAPGDLEQERRSRFVARVRAILQQPQAFGDEVLDAWLADIGAASVSDLLVRFRSVILPSALRLSLSPPLDTPPSPVSLPLTGAILIRDAGFSLAGLLRDSKAARDCVASLGAERAHDPALRPRAQPLVIWIIPESVFADDDWPGAQPGMSAAARLAARRHAAGQWLLREGIGLAAVPA